MRTAHHLYNCCDHKSKTCDVITPKVKFPGKSIILSTWIYNVLNKKLEGSEDLEFLLELIS